MEKIIEHLKQKGYRITENRLNLLKVFSENPGIHFTADTLQKKLLEETPKVNVMSLYNNLRILLIESIIKESVFKGTKVYELADINHTHFYCKKCNTQIEINFDELYSFNKQIQKKYNIIIEDTKVEFTGMCWKCIKGWES